MNFDVRKCSFLIVKELCEKFHSYKTVGNVMVYAYAVYEDNIPIAVFAWQPPAPGCSTSVCPEHPAGVLALSRMVAVPKTERVLKHISKPLSFQMKHLIDRTRYPVLVTFSDEGEGHTGYVYQCSGWQKTIRTKANVYTDYLGNRVSSYSNGGAKTGVHLTNTTYIQRWEHWVCEKKDILSYVENTGWRKVPTGRKYRSGNPAYIWVRT